jgi:hypothetical protein
MKINKSSKVWIFNFLNLLLKIRIEIIAYKKIMFKQIYIYIYIYI